MCVERMTQAAGEGKDPLVDAVVECHSGTTYAERPQALHWQGERLEIAEIIAQWRIPEGRHFRVCLTNGAIFALTYLESGDEWRIQEE